MWGWIPNGILAAGPSRVTIRRKATADIGAPRSLMKTYRPGFCSRWSRAKSPEHLPGRYERSLPSQGPCRRHPTQQRVDRVNADRLEHFPEVYGQYPSPLLLVKPTKRVKHTGGQRIKPDSDEEKSLLTWINYLAGLSDAEVRLAR